MKDGTREEEREDLPSCLRNRKQTGNTLRHFRLTSDCRVFIFACAVEHCVPDAGRGHGACTEIESVKANEDGPEREFKVCV